VVANYEILAPGESCQDPGARDPEDPVLDVISIPGDDALGEAAADSYEAEPTSQGVAVRAGGYDTEATVVSVDDEENSAL
jgi:hypothetical protein